MATIWEDSFMFDTTDYSVSTADFICGRHVTGELQTHDSWMFFVSQAPDIVC